MIEARTIQYADPLGSIEILAGEGEFKKVRDLPSTFWNDDVMSSQNIWREFKKFIEHSTIINPCQAKVNNFNILLQEYNSIERYFTLPTRLRSLVSK